MSTTQTPDVNQRLLYGAIAVAVLAKLADAATTVVGLQWGYVELNPVVAAIQAALGSTLGTLVALVVATTVVAAGIEVLARLLASWWSGYRDTFRVAGYAVFAAESAVIVGHNVVILA